MPTISHVLETALYVEDLESAVAFYRDILGLRVIEAGSRLVVMYAGQATLLLLFRRGATTAGVDMPEGWIPPHDGGGPTHVAFAISREALNDWEQHLRASGVAIESRVQWERGGQSLYFRDPEGHSVELATPGTWTVF